MEQRRHSTNGIPQVTPDPGDIKMQLGAVLAVNLMVWRLAHRIGGHSYITPLKANSLRRCLTRAFEQEYGRSNLTCWRLSQLSDQDALSLIKNQTQIQNRKPYPKPNR